MCEPVFVDEFGHATEAPAAASMPLSDIMRDAKLLMSVPIEGQLTSKYVNSLSKVSAAMCAHARDTGNPTVLDFAEALQERAEQARRFFQMFARIDMAKHTDTSIEGRLHLLEVTDADMRMWLMFAQVWREEYRRVTHPFSRALEEKIAEAKGELLVLQSGVSVPPPAPPTSTAASP